MRSIGSDVVVLDDSDTEGIYRIITSKKRSAKSRRRSHSSKLKRGRSRRLISLSDVDGEEYGNDNENDSYEKVEPLSSRRKLSASNHIERKNSNIFDSSKYNKQRSNSSSRENHENRNADENDGAYTEEIILAEGVI